ncbi:DUF2341 domain-containing protein [archaeon]|nr:DUF2341 domain-containing protein [archaeon]
MKIKTNVFLFLVVCVLFLPITSAENPYLNPMVTTHELVAEKTFNGFTTSWYYSPGLTNQEYIIAIQNLEDVNRETDISSLFSETNFGIDDLSNIHFSEYKNVSYTYLVNHYYEVEHSEWNEANQTWNNWTEQVYSHNTTETAVKPDWKACKMNTFSQGANDRKEDYGDMLIPKFTSKDKGDGTIDGTKIFRLTFDTPIINSGAGYGSSGRVALTLDNIEHCPYWNTSFSSRIPITITTNGTSTPSNNQVRLNISYESEMQADFDDIRFTNSSDGEIAYWIESKANLSYANVWVNLSDVITDPGSDTIWMYYGNPELSDGSDEGNTFIESFTGSSTGWTEVDDGSDIAFANDRLEFTNLPRNVDGYVYKSFARASDNLTLEYAWNITSNNAGQIIFLPSISNSVDDLRNQQNHYSTGRIVNANIASTIEISDSGYVGNSVAFTPNTTYYNVVTRVGNTITTKIYTDAAKTNLLDTSTITQATIPSLSYLFLMSSYNSGDPNLISGWIDNMIVREYIADEPTLTYGSSQYYTDSLHYNTTSPYNHTIESDGTITANRSIISADDTNDTALSTGTSYLIINVFDNEANIVRNFTFTGDNLDWYQAANLSGSYDLKNSTGIIETQTNGNFTTNLTAGTYWIEKTGISISLVSFTPSPLYTNYSGESTISYIVESYYPLNLSSLAFLHGVNYTITGDMHNYISVPYNDISDGYYKAPDRNVTPYLSWEFNDTISGGNVWQWGGGDNNSSWITNTPINATHTWINITRMVPQSLSNAYFIDDEALYNAPMTGFEINRQQGLILKGWDLEQIRNRNNNYFVSLFFDTSFESSMPAYPVEIGYCNDSYDPAVDDIDTCTDCIKFGEWNGTRWVNHSWDPSVNASYASPLVINASHFTDPSPDDIAYIWLRSYAHSSKSFVLNATDYDPGLTNITFADTQSMWTYNELNGVTTPVAYTPSYFAMFTRDYEEFLHHLYIADNQGLWGHSEIFNESIGISSVPVSAVSFEHFNVTCNEDYIEDTLMDATYDDGSILVNIFCPADPDGGTVSHNLTLHYALNQSLVAVINDTFTTTGNEYVDINFTTTPHYSTSDFYTLRCVSTDDENDVATKWLISDFTLDADGNQGWVVDDALLFWGMNDIPTLYATVANDSLISYNADNDIYTMHIPFFKSKSNDTFYFNETVHLESLNNENVSYFRHSGETIFDYATINAWNTTTDTAALITDEYRGYVYSHFHVCGNITNSDISYLGSDLYRNEGLNFIDNPHDYLIFNTTLSHNAEGLIMEYCSNMNISQCTIIDNVNVGLGIYFSNDTIVSNNVIDSNGGRGITMYEANKNIISYNDIINSGIHGVHYWSNSQNNSCTGNDISESALYDYYLSSSSLGNYIIDPASATDRIRVTSTSSVNIENTDNAAFSEDSLNTSYAYLTNFSMYVSGASQTFDITQYDMTIVPSNDNLSIQNFEWGNTIQFNAESSIGVNQTWFNITSVRWKNEHISIFVDELPYNVSYADDNGTLTYNYSVSIGDNFFEFVLTIPPSPVPVSLYIFMGVLLFVFCGASFILAGIPSIFTSILSIMFSFIMSKIAVNGSLVQNIGGISSTGTVIQGVTRIEIPALSYILIFVGIFMTVILVIQVLREIKFRESQDIIELDL